MTGGLTGGLTGSPDSDTSLTVTMIVWSAVRGGVPLVARTTTTYTLSPAGLDGFALSSSSGFSKSGAVLNLSSFEDTISNLSLSARLGSSRLLGLHLRPTLGR